MAEGEQKFELVPRKDGEIQPQERRALSPRERKLLQKASFMHHLVSGNLLRFKGGVLPVRG